MSLLKTKRNDLVYPELCFKIVGVLYDVYNNLGFGHSEKVYQKAVAEAFRTSSVIFSESVFSPVVYKGKNVGRNYFDFLVDGKVILELKKGDRFSKTHIDQVYKYLVSSSLKLGLLAYFTPTKVHYKRIVNLN